MRAADVFLLARAQEAKRKNGCYVGLFNSKLLGCAPVKTTVRKAEVS